MTKTDITGGKGGMYPSKKVLDMKPSGTLDMTAEMVNAFQEYIQLNPFDESLNRMQRICIDIVDAIEHQRTYVKCDTLSSNEIEQLRANGYTILQNPKGTYIITWISVIKMDADGYIGTDSKWTMPPYDGGYIDMSKRRYDQTPLEPELPKEHRPCISITVELDEVNEDNWVHKYDAYIEYEYERDNYDPVEIAIHGTENFDTTYIISKNGVDYVRSDGNTEKACRSQLHTLLKCIERDKSHIVKASHVNKPHPKWGPDSSWDMVILDTAHDMVWNHIYDFNGYSIAPHIEMFSANLSYETPDGRYEIDPKNKLIKYITSDANVEDKYLSNWEMNVLMVELHDWIKAISMQSDVEKSVYAATAVQRLIDVIASICYPHKND